ncbi:MAG: hypothetical protein ACR2H1_15380 [Limisphaerales bacterium]
MNLTVNKLPNFGAFLFLLIFRAPAIWAGTYSFANTNFLTITDSGTPPTPASSYPFSVIVSNIPSNEKIDKITVTFHNLSHAYSGDIDVLLVGPGGTNLILFSDVGTNVSGATITLDDEATAMLPTNGLIVAGVFKPANYGVTNDPFPAPAPAPSSATNLSIFKGTNPNGLWRLYVVDDLSGRTGSMAGGWSMTIRTAAQFTNSAPIQINSASPPTMASPYPSSITVSNLIGNVIKVTATLHGFAHSYPDDVDILLSAPTVTNLVLMSDAGGNLPVTNLTLTFDDSAGVQMPDEEPLTNRIYFPFNFSGTDSFPSPAPFPSLATNLSIFNGRNPNGTWNLYVVDDNLSDAGQIANGWSLNIVTEIPAPVIINPRRLGNIFQFDWLSVTGVIYQVERKFDLSAPSWTAGGPFVGNGGLLSVNISATGLSQQFFRVVVVSP